MTTSFENSRGLIARAMECEALIGERPSLFLTGYEPAKGAPKFVRSASASRIIDVDGNEFIDLVMGYGSVVLGHGHPVVQDSVIAALSNGANPTLLSEVHLDLAEKIKEVVPNAERVTFLKTGSDAVDAAVRLARAITGRRHVLHWGMHGWHDWCCHQSPGVLEEVKRFTTSFEYGDIGSLRALLDRHEGDVACVVMMPYADVMPAANYLTAVREACDEYGSLLIFDEVRSGFRIALGGAQQYFNVRADLVALSKAMANGYSISAIAGNASHLSRILDLNLTVTFYRDPIPMSAALATIGVLQREDIPARLAHFGKALKSHLSASASRNSIPVNLVGHESSPSLKFGFGDERKNGRAVRAFCSAMIGRGVLVHPLLHWFVSASLTERDLVKIFEAIDESMVVVARSQR